MYFVRGHFHQRIPIEDTRHPFSHRDPFWRPSYTKNGEPGRTLGTATFSRCQDYARIEKMGMPTKKIATRNWGQRRYRQGDRFWGSKSICCRRRSMARIGTAENVTNVVVFQVSEKSQLHCRVINQCGRQLWLLYHLGTMGTGMNKCISKRKKRAQAFIFTICQKWRLVF